jgi:hypothetical protein
MQANEGPVYRYTIIGMLVTDTPLDRMDFDQYVVDGASFGLLEAIENLPRRASIVPVGAAESVLTNLNYTVESTKNDNRAGDRIVFVCKEADRTKIENIMNRVTDRIRISRNGWTEIEFRLSDHEVLKRRRAGANQGICWVGWTERGDDRTEQGDERLFAFVCDGTSEMEYSVCDDWEDPEFPATAFEAHYHKVLKEILGVDSDSAPAYGPF